jgi:N-acetylglutamate synthase-like GNAT family acetyltransferase
MTPLADPSIVQATKRDIDDLAHLIRQSFTDVAIRFELTRENCPKHPSNCTRDWIQRDLDRGVDYYLLLADGTAAGCVGVEQASPTTCYLERLAVLPEQRGKGYGTRLAGHAINEARAMGASTVGIGIIAADTGLKAFYRTLGFKEGETKSFPHLPFGVALMNIQV